MSSIRQDAPALEIDGASSDEEARHTAPDELLELARAAGAGSAEAARSLILHIGGGMLRTVRKVLGVNHPDLEDVAQDSAVAVLLALPQFRGESSVARFANRITLLTALSARRRQRQRLLRLEGAAESVRAQPGSAESPLSAMISERRRALVLRLLDDLSEPISRVLALHYMLGFSVEDIAQAEGLSPNTVWTRIRLGKAALRRKFANHTRWREFLGSGE